MAFTLRLNPKLQTEAAAYAERVGLSLTGLVAVALRDYLDARRPMPRSGSPSKPAPTAPVETSSPGGSSVPPAEVTNWSVQHRPELGAVNPHPKPPPGGRSAPCPCGSRLKWKQCHGRG